MRSRGHAHRAALPHRARRSRSRVDPYLIGTPSPSLLSSDPLWQPLHTGDQARPEQPGRMLPAAKSAKGKPRPIWDGGSAPRLSTAHAGCGPRQ